MHTIELSYLKYLDILADEDYGMGLSWYGDSDRTGTGTRRMAAPVLIESYCEAPENNEIPLFTIRPIWWGGLVAEFCWMMSGSVSINDLDDLHTGASKLWSAWARPASSAGFGYGSPHIGKGYGYQFNGPLYKLATAVQEIQARPDTRRACFTLWEQTNIPSMALPPCHGCWIQFRAFRDPRAEDHTRILTLAHTQRSQDACVGAPYNVVFYQLLLRVIVAWLNAQAQHRKEEVVWVEGWVTHTICDLHLYENHLEGAAEMVARRRALDDEHLVNRPPTPTCTFDPPTEFGRLTLADALRILHPAMFKLGNYNPVKPHIKFPVAV